MRYRTGIWKNAIVKSPIITARAPVAVVHSGIIWSDEHQLLSDGCMVPSSKRTAVSRSASSRIALRKRTQTNCRGARSMRSSIIAAHSFCLPRVQTMIAVVALRVSKDL